jgi:hypothetical protein
VRLQQSCAPQHIAGAPQQQVCAPQYQSRRRKPPEPNRPFRARANRLTPFGHLCRAAPASNSRARPWVCAVRVLLCLDCHGHYVPEFQRSQVRAARSGADLTRNWWSQLSKLFSADSYFKLFRASYAARVRMSATATVATSRPASFVTRMVHWLQSPSPGWLSSPDASHLSFQPSCVVVRQIQFAAICGMRPAGELKMVARHSQLPRNRNHAGC